MKEIVIYEKRWDQIPHQDNPAFHYRTNDKNERVNEAILVMPVLPYLKCVGRFGFSVIEVPLMGDVVTRGLFWHKEHALLFAEALKSNK